MPELPEVETTLRGIAPHILRQTVSAVTVCQPKLRWQIPPTLPETLHGLVVRECRRRAKYLLIRFDTGVLLIHFRMSVCRVRAVCTHAVFLNYFPFPPNQRSSETHFQTTFFHFAKQIFPPPSPQTSSEPVNFPYFNNFLEANYVRYPPAPPVPAPYRRTRPVVFSAGQGSRCPKNFCRALSGGGVRFGKLFGMAEAG